MKQPFPSSLLVAGLVVAALACGARGSQDGAHAAHAPAVTKAIAVLAPTKGSTVQGTVTFTKESGGIRVHGEISGLSPGLHGFHVHEWGNVSKDDGSGCGSHYNPHGAQHGDASATARHVGDLGNIEADAQGKAVYDRLDTMLSLQDAESIIGRGLIVHEKADDFGQPVGNAGGRVAQAVIGVAEIAK